MVSSSARVGSINVLLTTQLGPGMAGLNAFAGAVDRTGVSVGRSVAGMDRSIGGLNRSLGNIHTRGMTSLTLGALRAGSAVNQLHGIALAAGVAVGGLFPAAVAAGMIRTVDGAHRLSNQLRTVTTDANDLKNTQDALFDVAQRTRSAFDSTVTIYARTARATEHLGLSQQKLLRITETVQKAFAIGGATAAEAQGAAIQLSQGIASNRFSGEEFRSVAENAPVLLRGMAESLGVNIGKLREMAHAGELTADVVTKAIIEASERIDREFGQITSTIEQAWVRVGNAVTKYAMDSEGAAASSRVLVGGLNLVADNVSGLMDIIMALGVALTATFAARRMQAVTGWVSGLKAARIEALAAAQANQLLAISQMQAARADFLQKRLAFNAALNAGTLSAKQLERQKKALAASSTAYRSATQAATAATVQLSTAQKAASASGMTMAAAGRAVSAAWAFIGGPMGAAMIALGGIMYMQAQRAAEASERSERYADAIKKAGENSSGASPGIKQVAADLFSVGAGATSAARQVSLAAAKARELGALRELFSAVEQFGIRGGWGVRHLYTELEEARKKFEAGEISAEQFLATTDKIAREAPGHLAAYIASAEKAAKESAAAAGEVEGIEKQVEKLDGKQATVTITIGTRTVELTDGGVASKGKRVGRETLDEAQERYNALFDFRRRMDPDEFSGIKAKKPKKTPAPRKTADDRFDNSVQAIYDRIEALRLEREMLGASFYEQTRREEALKLEQEALKQVREEARRKGEADWQNAQISAAKRAEIEKVSAALAAEADATRRATEAMEFNRDILKDVLSGMREALADGKITWEEIGDVAIRVLDKIINKIEDELIESIFNMNQAGASGGGGGGGILGFLGGLLGFGGGIKLPATAPIPTPRPIMDSGGAMLASGLVSFGPKTRMLQADSGFGPRNFMAVLEEGESVLTGNQMDRTMGALSAATDKIKEGGRASDHSVLEVALSPDLIAKVLQQAGNQTVKIVRGNDRARKNIYDNGGNPP